MIFPRAIETFLSAWRDDPYRKPLILRGARQTGKTTVIQEFGKSFPQFISLNLERHEDRRLFLDERPLSQVVDEMFFIHDANRADTTLIFIDEIQNSSRAVSLLRYFYEDYPQYHIIAAGSLLEQSFDLKTSFPVGRVQFAYVHPVSFEEFLLAADERSALKAYSTVPVPDYAHQRLSGLFQQYLFIGGMPEAVRVYLEGRDLGRVSTIQRDLVSSFTDDILKYTGIRSIHDVIGHVFSQIFSLPCERITYNGFQNSPYGSRQVKQVFTHLEKAMLCQVIHPLTRTEFPMVRNLKKKPRLHLLDTGLCCNALGIQQELLSLQDLSQAARGRIAEHIVGQELKASSPDSLDTINFWVREKSQSSAEIDYILPFGNSLVPIEVKSGSTGTMRSLFQFMDRAGHATALRIYGGRFSLTELHSREGKPFNLISIPYYHAGKAVQYIRELSEDPREY